MKIYKHFSYGRSFVDPLINSQQCDGYNIKASFLEIFLPSDQSITIFHLVSNWKQILFSLRAETKMHSTWTQQAHSPSAFCMWSPHSRVLVGFASPCPPPPRPAVQRYIQQSCMHGCVINSTIHMVALHMSHLSGWGPFAPLQTFLKSRGGLISWVQKRFLTKTETFSRYSEPQIQPPLNFSFPYRSLLFSPLYGSTGQNQSFTAPLPTHTKRKRLGHLIRAIYIFKMRKTFWKRNCFCSQFRDLLSTKSALDTFPPQLSFHY